MVDNILSIDWFAITIWEKIQIETYNEIMETVCAMLGFESWSTPKKGSRGYRVRHNGSEGANLYSQPYEMNHGNHAHLELPGQACALINPDKFRDLFVFLQKNDVRYNIARMDVALDHQNFTPADLWKALENEQFESRVHRKSITRVFDLAESGDTVYLGSKTSETYIRVYKKYTENHDVFGDSDYTRVELVVKNERATYLYNVFGANPLDHWMVWAKSTLNAYFSVLTNWWSEWLESLNRGALFRIQNPPKSLDRTAQWLYKQVSASLKMFVSALAGNNPDLVNKEIQDLLDFGADKLSKEHLMVIDDYRMRADYENRYQELRPEIEYSPQQEQVIQANNNRLQKQAMTKRNQYRWAKIEKWLHRVVLEQFPEWFGVFEYGDVSIERMSIKHIDSFDRLVYGLPDGDYMDMLKIDWQRVKQRVSSLPDSVDLPFFEPAPVQLPLEFNDSIELVSVNHWQV